MFSPWFSAFVRCPPPYLVFLQFSECAVGCTLRGSLEKEPALSPPMVCFHSEDCQSIAAVHLWIDLSIFPLPAPSLLQVTVSLNKEMICNFLLTRRKLKSAYSFYICFPSKIIFSSWAWHFKIIAIVYICSNTLLCVEKKKKKSEKRSEIKLSCVQRTKIQQWQELLRECSF